MNIAIRWWEKLRLILTVTLLWPILAFSGNDISITLDPLVGGLVSPVFVSHAGDGTGRLFIVEQAGRILIFQNGNLEKTPFLDVRDRVTSGGELGLLSVAFHPDFRNNGRFFVNYTNRRPNLKSFISEYHVSSGNPFAGGGGLPEIWAYGLRNPWRFSFDRLTGRLFAGDVGQNSYEEIDLISRGGNFGWNIISPFGEDESGELYVVNYGGSLHRLRLLSPVLPHQPAILVPSAARWDRFFSSLSVVNIDSTANSLLIRAFGMI